jgi:hypothetical protein
VKESLRREIERLVAEYSEEADVDDELGAILKYL